MDVRGERLRAIFFEKLLNHPLGLVVFAFAEVVIANASLAVDEVVRRPVFVVESLPDFVVAVDGDGISDLQIANRFFHVGAVFFEREFRSMHADDDQAGIFVFRRPRPST